MPEYGQYAAPAYGQYAQQNNAGYTYPPQGVPGQQYPPQGAYYYGQPVPTERWNALSIAGFVLSFLISPVGLILSIVALVQINKSHEKSKGMAIAGIIIGALGTVLAVVLFALVIWLVGYSVDHMGDYSMSCDSSGNCYFENGDYGMSYEELERMLDGYTSSLPTT
ncbi:DUF4190 domain-containing protein [Bifidobacterium eulemuris]|nr:DUF4190 domain-containing protein [Bifidobacterium eulemuris]QOL33144.1 DUF4190 domain-containing protein [Bifidobacterium eulemuris]